MKDTIDSAIYETNYEDADGSEALISSYELEFEETYQPTLANQLLAGLADKIIPGHVIKKLCLDYDEELYFVEGPYCEEAHLTVKKTPEGKDTTFVFLYDGGCFYFVNEVD